MATVHAPPARFSRVESAPAPAPAPRFRHSRSASVLLIASLLAFLLAACSRDTPPAAAGGPAGGTNPAAVDGAVEVVGYSDVDGDGFGVGTGQSFIEQLPPGFALNNDDCNDASAAINPAATEMAVNGMDDDCDGLVDADDVETPALPSAAPCVIQGGAVVNGIVHSNGLGETYTDCVPLGTYNAVQARAACDSYLEAYEQAHPEIEISSCSKYECPMLFRKELTVIWRGEFERIIWSYEGEYPGHVRRFPTENIVECPWGDDPVWN